MTRPRTLLLTWAALLALAAPAQADSVVDTHEDVVAADGKCSLREAVEFAADCGTGTIHLPGGGGPYLLSTTLPIAVGTVPTRIEATGAVLQATGAPHRVLVVATGRTAFLSGLTITGGTATAPTFAGGGIFNFGNLTLERVVVAGNTVTPAAPGANGGATGGTGGVGGNGAGIFNQAGATLTLDRSTVSGNTAGTGGTGGVGDFSSPAAPSGARGGVGGKGGSGGGIFNAGTLTLTDSTITGNAAGGGGAGGAGTSGSPAGGHGGFGGHGGIGGDGGGIANTGTLTIVRSTIAGNRAGRGGDGAPAGDGGDGGTVDKDGGPAGFGGSAGNGGHGGGVYTSAGATTVTNATIATNAGGAGGTGSAGGNGGQPGGPGGALGPAGPGGEGGDGGSGGGLLAESVAAVTLTLTHATIARNAVGALGAGGPAGSGAPGPFGSPAGDSGSPGFGSAVYVNAATVSARNSIFGGNACTGEIDDLGGNASSPGSGCAGLQRDPLLGPLASNGGPTQTIGLRAGSPAIDLVSSNCATTDQRGVQRPVGGRCDAGAFEAPPAARPGATKPALGSPRSKLKKKRLRLTYAVSGSGTLTVRLFMKRHRRIGRATAHPTQAGDVTLRITLARRALRALRAKHKLRISARAVFTPTGGTPIARSKRLTLHGR
jgi:CSLREA domain-containing protein